ncbi:hypothetical protein [Pelagovum pacificum]|uniref:Uncharacterized protein n=1 Tax=Pelagovum pacificum TaxID=2588711 RepID=A0A5C5GFF8_9RHOB|nr:hypothetical protein [Pelagovum pacificum]QQA44188.1 hypothetical protein I8N54_06310 [Pelagovum pacificum]TNY32689.1 hypothetical protein FHY64_05255 [Pelagovum pacificum]
MRIAALLPVVMLAACTGETSMPSGEPLAAADVQTVDGVLVARGDSVSDAALEVMSYCGITPETTLLDILIDIAMPVEGEAGAWRFTPPPGCA